MYTVLKLFRPFEGTGEAAVAPGDESDAQMCIIFYRAYWPFVYVVWRNVCSSPVPICNFIDFFCC